MLHTQSLRDMTDVRDSAPVVVKLGVYLTIHIYQALLMYCYSYLYQPSWACRESLITLAQVRGMGTV